MIIEFYNLSRGVGTTTLAAVQARLCSSTIARVRERPNRAQLGMLVRLTVAAGRADLLDLRPRRPTRSETTRIPTFTPTAPSPAHAEL